MLPPWGEHDALRHKVRILAGSFSFDNLASRNGGIG